MILSRRSALTGALSLAAMPALARAEDAPVAISPPGAILGEGPLWSARDNTLYWVDIRGKKLHAYRLSDGSQPSWDMPDLIDWIVLRESGGFLVAILRTVHALTLEPFSLTPLFTIEADKTDNRLNDAKVDPQGRLWTGTMHMPFNKKDCALYRIDTDLSVHMVDAPYLCTNGPGFNRDGSRMYHNETAERLVYAFDVAPDGSLSNKKIFAKFGDGVGLPDGIAVDAQDGVWVSHYNGGRVTRYLPDGTADFDVMVPAKQSTSLTFAGPNLDRVFCTTAAQPPVDADDKLAGTLFELPKSWLRGHTGLPTVAFKG